MQLAANDGALWVQIPGKLIGGQSSEITRDETVVKLSIRPQFALADSLVVSRGVTLNNESHNPQPTLFETV